MFEIRVHVCGEFRNSTPRYRTISEQSMPEINFLVLRQQKLIDFFNVIVLLYIAYCIIFLKRRKNIYMNIEHRYRTHFPLFK